MSCVGDWCSLWGASRGIKGLNSVAWHHRGNINNSKCFCTAQSLHPHVAGGQSCSCCTQS